MFDPNWRNWTYIAGECPFTCEISHLAEEDYKPAVDENGIECKRATHHFVPGEISVVSETFGWRFSHPGLKGGSIFIHALMSDTTPRYSEVTFSTSE